MKRLYSLLTLVGTLTLMGSLLGYVRNASVASVFGLSGESDAYFVAIFIPTTLQAILILGALSPALVHVYVNYVEAGKRDDARIIFSSIVNLIAGVASVLVVLGMVFSRQLVDVIAPGLSAETARLSAHLMMFTLPVLLFLCLAALLGPILNTKDHFSTPALNPVVLNVFTLVFIVAGARTMGITAAAVGILVGAAAHLALLTVFLRRKGIAYSPILRLGHPGVRRVLAKSAPAAGYMGVAYCAPLLERLLASFKGEGAVTIIAIALTVFALPTTVFNASLGIVIYPRFVRLAAAARAELGGAMMQASRLVLVVLIPATLLMIAACVPLTRLAYGPGSVSSADVRTGGAVLAAYVVGLSAVGLTQVLQKGIYAAGDFVTPLKVEVISFSLYAAAAVGLSYQWSIVGLAVARAGAFALSTVLTFWMVRRMPGIPSVRKLAAFAVKPLLAATAAVAFYAAAFLFVDRAYPSSAYVLTAAEQVVLLATAGGVYLAVSALLGVEEVRLLRRLAPAARLRAAASQEAA